MLSSVVRASRIMLEYGTLLLADIADEEMTQPVNGIVNHPAWQIGHIIAVWGFANRALGGEVDERLHWTRQCGPGSKPGVDRSLYPPKKEIVDSMISAHTYSINLLQAVRPPTLAAAMPDEKYRSMFPTVGDAAVFVLTAHTGTHLGQLSAWRRARGMPGVF